MTQSSIRTWGFLTLVAASGCEDSDRPCNPALDQDDQLTVEVQSVSRDEIGALGAAPVTGLPSCGLDDLSVGDKFEITLHDHVAQSSGSGICHHFACPLDLPAPAAKAAKPLSWANETYVCLGNAAEVQLSATCSLGRFTAIYTSGDTDLDHGPSVGSTTSPYLLVRGLAANSGACSDLATRFPSTPQNGNPILCVDQYRVQLTKHAR